ncbi:MAG: M48 family metalloprotease [Anaeromyxobacter sp.]
MTASRLLGLVLTGCLLAACVRNPVTGKRQLALVSSEQEIALGKQSAEEVRQTMGTYDDPKVKAYVSGVGMRMATASERPRIPWQFDVVDDPAVNAFALPGGPIFVTRGILTHLRSEAELAAVVGHEIGHVTARHSVQQLSKQQLAQVGLGLGAVLSPELGQLGQLASAGMQLLFLKYGRDDERQSDELGFRYMTAAGYDPREMPKVFEMLAKASALSGGGRVPEWMSTHPDPENRAKKAAERAAGVEGADRMKVDEAGYLALVDGMVFGDDPRQGFFEGQTFKHPGLGFQLAFPKGWKTENGAAAVQGVSAEQDAAVQLSVVTGAATPEEAKQKFFAQEGIRPATTLSAEAPRNAARFEAQTQQGALGGYVTFASAGKVTLQLVGFAPEAALSKHDAELHAALASFGPLTDRAALDVKPARVKLVKLDRDQTVAEFMAAHPSNADPKLVALINGVDEGGRMKAGTLAKQVVGGPPAQAARQP